jgi:hypothetical protein
MKKLFCLAALAVVLVTNPVRATLGDEAFISFTPEAGSLALMDNKAVVPLLVDAGDWVGVKRAVGDLQADFHRVTGISPVISDKPVAGSKTAVLVGTVGHSALIDQLAKSKKIDVSPIAGRWEAFLIQVVEQPLPGVDRALVIAGSDKRGTIYGVYEISEQIGVSPWYWWADVPVVRRSSLFVRPVTRVDDGPAVKYRGIFLNDEAPALSGWTAEKFGGVNSAFYTKVFELILRLRGNYLWPAMWGNAFNEDDPANPRLADEYGIVMGTSHHEPMLRAQQEWKRHGTGPWNYHTNGDVLRKFWADGIRRNRDFESIITIGMRGDGDEPMSEESNIALLQGIVADQREILTKETGKPIEQVPQMWALYKEVQEYYERGMRVPDDVMLLWCDDNWGNIRRLPTEAERKRSGGAGIYYHFDYVGGPRNYKWLNTAPISKTWEQMNLAWHYGADRLWLVNVGDLKPMEFPIEFFLKMGWAPERWTNDKLDDYGRLWAAREFGAENAAAIAELVATYTKYNSRRKPEMLSPSTFSLVNYGEAERIVADWNELAARAEKLEKVLPASHHDAFFQLVLWPIKACAIVNEMYVEAGKNRLYASQGRASANAAAEKVLELYRADAAMTRRYNEDLTSGKWRHLADQAHIGYTYWQQPDAGNIQPTTTRLDVANVQALGVAIEGSTQSWPADDFTRGVPVLPPLDFFGASSRTIEVFNRGLAPFSFAAMASQPWVRIAPASGEVKADQRLTVSVDWDKVPVGDTHVKIVVKTQHQGPAVWIDLPVHKAADVLSAGYKGFVESERFVAIEAEHWTGAVFGDVSWQVIPGYGRTLSGVTFFPVDAPSRMPTAQSPRLEYNVFFQDSGEAAVHLVTAPTLNFVPGRGLRCAISIDDEAPQIVDLLGDLSMPAWERAVGDGARRVLAGKLTVSKPGVHVVKFWPVDPAIVLERIELDLGGLRPSYLGAPESRRF